MTKKPARRAWPLACAVIAFLTMIPALAMWHFTGRVNMPLALFPLIVGVVAGVAFGLRAWLTR